MKLAGVMVAATMAVTLAATCVTGLIDQSSTAVARACGARIAAVAAAEYADGCVVNSDRILTGLTVPGNVRMIVFGTAPGNGGTTHCTGMYTIQYNDGRNETYFTIAPLGADGPGPARGSPLTLYPGRYVIHISIRPVDGRMMALIGPEAD
ncbi:MAG: hypothetical protein A4E28_00134 [Methanocella sp. PtaU1.Bin125]|nr:MAG: hypothetical protein A4E28_00134 [Methanocella sp. PtaU1.Bin125]